MIILINNITWGWNRSKRICKFQGTRAFTVAIRGYTWGKPYVAQKNEKKYELPIPWRSDGLTTSFMCIYVYFIVGDVCRHLCKFSGWKLRFSINPRLTEYGSSFTHNISHDTEPIVQVIELVFIANTIINHASADRKIIWFYILI